MFSRFDQQTVALTVVTNVANTWFTALSLADRLAVARSNLNSAEQTLAVVHGRFDAGTASQLDIAQQETLVDGERALIPNFISQLEQQIIALGILTGQPPERVAVHPGTLTALALPLVAPGLPSELLARRPDVASAEAQLIAQNFSITEARAAFFPSIQLTGSAGYQAPALNRLITPGGALAALTEGLTLPLFDGGTLRGQLDLAKGRDDELLADYRKAVVQAFTDVDTALTAWRYATEQEALQRVAVETGAPGGDDRARADGRRDGGHYHRADRRDDAVQRRGHAGAGSSGACAGAAKSVQGSRRRMGGTGSSGHRSVSRPDARHRPGGVALPVGGNVR